MTPTKESPIMMKHYLKDEAVTALDGTTRIFPAGSTVRVYIEQPDDSPTQPQWTGEGLPPVGAEFEFSLNGESWEERVMLFNDGITCLMAHLKHPANRWHYKCDDPDILFRPIRTQAEIERDEVIDMALDSADFLGAPSEIAAELYDAGLLRKPMSREEAYDKIKDAQSGIQVGERKLTITNHAAHRILDALGYKD